ncbi:GNAT family N-acetyltransferase [Pseudoalteromonas citrea]|uniref:GNAT family N-acetyltransferase n=1 Tax=Pseudoalteromonas citrea TaxID=43655 RepID=A0A5S3XLJ2_9GAMM|nr:GNAT family N-acetyltransferase [Pseudoalteromonas citrea]TMP41140.1 GNAT family N-acetyltransferase [Pseudoalteromonas citrea]TMP53751.1 GNAT family N-acetyltransferase [Pseudoalteromonas citrea]
MIHIFEPKTKRLQLRQWTPEDLDAFFAMSSDSEVMKFFPHTLSREESDATAKKCQSLIEKNGWGVWAVELIDSKEFIGIVGLYNPTAELPCAPCVEILWRLSRKYWGHGYATEAAEAVLQIGFEELNFNEIYSFAVVKNHSSRAVMERLDMVNTGENFLHPDVPNPEHLREHCIYKFSQLDWVKSVT